MEADAEKKPQECDHCKKPIEGKCINALGKAYHPMHFVCDKCKKPITDNEFQQKDGKPLCMKDYEDMLPKCHGCNKVIREKVIKGMGKEWHEEHFVCNLCKEKLIGQSYVERKGRPICEKCFNTNIADKCKACEKIIDGPATVALDAKWHPDCFKCKKCKNPIKCEKIKVDTDGMPICDKC